MSEELEDASLHLPRAMMWATFGNGVMGIVMLISFCFCITDLDATLQSDYPIIQVLYSATRSYAATSVLGSVLVILVFFSTVTTIASASRQTWAFSRDQVSQTSTIYPAALLTLPLGLPIFSMDTIRPSNMGDPTKCCEFRRQYK